MKKPTSFRLTAPALRLIKALAEKQGLSQTAVVEVAVRKMARDEGLSPPNIMGVPAPRGEREQ